MTLTKKLLLSLLLLVCILPFNLQAALNQGGLTLTFDDDYVDQWHDFFINNNQNIDLSGVKATFFVSNFHLLSITQVNKLLALQAAGHEIASHSYSHGEIDTSDPNVDDPALINTYLNNQVITSINNMRAAGFDPVSFSYPSGGHTAAYDEAIRPYLPYLRSTVDSEHIDDIFHSDTSSYTFLSGDSLDIPYVNSVATIRSYLDRANNEKSIVTLYGHRIYTSTQSNNYSLTAANLANIINYAKNTANLKFYTFKEAYTLQPTSPVPTLTVNKTGSGSGTVTSSPAGINCGTDCTETYTSGTNVTLTATASSGSTFSGWSGGGCSGTSSTCTVSMTAAQSVTASFTADAPPPPPPSNATISISIENTNRVRLSWSNMPNHNFVGIVPTTQPDWQAGMSGANTDGSTSGKLGITVAEAVAGQQYQAIFYLSGIRVVASDLFVIIPGSTPTTYTLSVSKDGTGTGMVSSTPAGIACGTDCTETYASGTSVTLTALADTGSTFSGWSGAGCSGTGNCTVSITAAQAVTAAFNVNSPPPPQVGTINITVENQKRVRSKWNGFAADFIGIVPFGQPNWLNGMEGANVNSNVTSGNVGVTVNNAPYNQQYVVMFYLNNVKVATSDPFIIRTKP